jgi:hypothetical protein
MLTSFTNNLHFRRRGSTLDQFTCRIVEISISPHQLTLSRISRLGLLFGRRRNELPHPVIIVRKCTSSNAKTHGLKHLQLPDMGASGGTPGRTRVVRHWMDELVIAELIDSSCKDTTILVSGQLSFSAGKYEATRSAVYLG